MPSYIIMFSIVSDLSFSNLQGEEGVGRLPYENAGNIIFIILLRGGNADVRLNFGCWDRRAIYP